MKPRADARQTPHDSFGGVRKHNGARDEWTQNDADRRPAWIEADGTHGGTLIALPSSDEALAALGRHAVRTGDFHTPAQSGMCDTERRPRE
ncbi:MAG: hypothetical protein ABI585_07600 [Betaproteobacteria bacterium]